MKLVSISVIRNESDILETFVRHHLPVLDLMIIVDHRSSDGSSGILSRLKTEGCPLEILEETGLEHRQEHVLTAAMRKAVHAHGADWVIPLDADEFLTTPAGTPVREVFAGIPAAADACRKIPWRTYVPTPGDDGSERNILRRITMHRARERPQYHKVIVPKAVARSPRAALTHGSHDVVRRSIIKKNRRFPAPVEDNLLLAHFPIRSQRQILGKAVVGWLSWLCKPDKVPGNNSHWKGFYDRFKSLGEISAEEMMEMALRYAAEETGSEDAEPLVRRPVISEGGGIILRYPEESRPEPLKMLAEVAEEMAEEVGRLRRRAAGRSVFPFRWISR